METVELTEENTQRGQFTVDDLDIEILPLIYEIIRRYLSNPNLQFNTLLKVFLGSVVMCRNHCDIIVSNV